jgi:hypothetical protein
MHIVHSWLNENEKQEARDLGARLRRGEIDALQTLELRVLRATKDNEHFTEWLSEVVRHVMSEEARDKLRRDVPAPPPEPPKYHRHRG